MCRGLSGSRRRCTDSRSSSSRSAVPTTAPSLTARTLPRPPALAPTCRRRFVTPSLVLPSARRTARSSSRSTMTGPTRRGRRCPSPRTRPPRASTRTRFAAPSTPSSTCSTTHRHVSSRLCVRASRSSTGSARRLTALTDTRPTGASGPTAGTRKGLPCSCPTRLRLTRGRSCCPCATCVPSCASCVTRTRTLTAPTTLSRQKGPLRT
mmetsp:Transcript_3417/g.11207  ORF Transcript_3417/g.11207 Transcript_3417/m.11207 type:complete len:208 (+) Transcript_3417:800-1423(+)